MDSGLTSKVSACTLALTILAGCASFKPPLRPQDLRAGRLPTASASEGELEISLEEFFTAEKSRLVFDADLVSHGILAFLVRIRNTDAGHFKIYKNDIRVSLDNQPLAAISADHTAAMTSMAGFGEYAGRAAFWTLATGPFFLLAWPVTILSSTAHTGSVNEKISNYFKVTEFRDAIVRPNEAQAGFIYFKFPSETKILENVNFEIEGVEMKSGKRLIYRLRLPTLRR